MSPKLKLLPLLLWALSVKLCFPAVKSRCPYFFPVLDMEHSMLTEGPLLWLGMPPSDRGFKSKSHVHVRIQENPLPPAAPVNGVSRPSVRATQYLHLSPVSGTNMSLFLSDCFLCSITNTLATDGISFLLWLPGSSKPCYKFNHTTHLGLDFWGQLPSLLFTRFLNLSWFG